MLMLMFSIYLGKRGISLHVKGVQPDVRDLYRLRAFWKKKRKKDYVRMIKETR